MIKYPTPQLLTEKKLIEKELPILYKQAIEEKDQNRIYHLREILVDRSVAKYKRLL